MRKRNGEPPKLGTGGRMMNNKLYAIRDRRRGNSSPISHPHTAGFGKARAGLKKQSKIIIPEPLNENTGGLNLSVLNWWR
jgi:hypothetical protein